MTLLEKVIMGVLLASIVLFAIGFVAALTHQYQWVGLLVPVSLVMWSVCGLILSINEKRSIRNEV